MKLQNVITSLCLLILLTANCGGNSPKEEMLTYLSKFELGHINLIQKWIKEL